MTGRRRVVSRLFSLLMHLVLPREFVRHYGQQLLEALEDLDDEARRSGSSCRYAGFLVREIWDLVLTGVRCRFPVPGRSRADTVGGRSGRVTACWPILSDVRFAVRTLKRGRGFTAGATVTLALGIGSSVALFSAVNSTLLRPLPFEDPNELVLVSLLIPPEAYALPGPDPIEGNWSYPKFRLLLEHQDIFENLAVFRTHGFTLTGPEGAEQVLGEVVGGSYFSVLGLRPEAGRSFLPEEDATQGTHRVVILSHDLWIRRFGGDAEVIGRSIHLRNTDYTVVGIGPEGFKGLSGISELWIPTMAESEARLASLAHSWSLIARLSSHVTPEQAATAMSQLGEQIDDVFPSTRPGGPWSATARALDEYRVSSTTRRSVLLLFTGAGLVLLVACVNVAGLLLSRGISRGREFATRLAIGAGRLRLLRQLVIEGLLLAVVGGGAGLGLAMVGVDLFNGLGVAARSEMYGLERLTFDSISIDASTLGFCILVAALTPLLFSIPPALGSIRSDLFRSLRGDHPADGPGTSWTRRFLVVTQVALAFVLMIYSAFLVTTLRRLHATEMGFQAAGVLSARVDLPSERYDLDDSRALLEELVERVRGLPAVESVTFSSCVPFAACRNLSSVLAVDGVEFSGDFLVGATDVFPGFFASMEIPLLAGRSFSAEDWGDTLTVAVISRSAALRLWSGEDPLGRELSLRGLGTPRVIGVVEDIRYSNLEGDPVPEVYLAQRPQRGGYLLVRTPVDPLSLVASVRAQVQALDRALPLFDVRSMLDRVSDASWETQFTTLISILFALLTLTLAAVGLFGAQAYVVAKQARAIGVRITLGATRWEVLSDVIGEALWTTVMGILVGVGLSLALTPHFGSLLSGTNLRDPETFGAISVLFLTVAVISSFLPGRQAAAVDPIKVLRAE